MERTARTLGRRAARGKRRPRIPVLILVTDPDRTPDPVAAAANLPRGAGVIYRSFGRADAVEVGLRLMALARARGLTVLVGADAGLATRLGADGVHLPERLLHLGRRLKARRPRWIVTGAAHGAAGLRKAARQGLDGALVSTVFASRSPSAGRPLGPVRFAGLVGRARLPVYALGGVNATTARRLLTSGAWGLAAVDGMDEGRGGAKQSQELEPGARHGEKPRR